MADVSLKTQTRVLAYCLMTNHFHLLLEIALASLETVMRRVLCRYSRTTNRKFKRYGHVFQARYKAKVCRGDRYYQRPKYDKCAYLCWRENPKPTPAKSLEVLTELIEREFAVNLHRDEAHVRPLKVGQGRRVFALRAVAEGHRAAAVAEFFGISPSAVSHALSAPFA